MYLVSRLVVKLLEDHFGTIDELVHGVWCPIGQSPGPHVEPSWSSRSLWGNHIEARLCLAKCAFQLELGASQLELEQFLARSVPGGSSLV